jgi:hypothetical protein
MADFSIALSGIRNTRTVNIEGLGVIGKPTRCGRPTCSLVLMNR